MEVSKLGVNKWGRPRKNRIQMTLKEEDEMVIIEHINDKIDINAYIKQLILDDYFRERDGVQLTHKQVIKIEEPPSRQEPVEEPKKESNLVDAPPEIDEDQLDKIKQLMNF